MIRRTSLALLALLALGSQTLLSGCAPDHDTVAPLHQLREEVNPVELIDYPADETQLVIDLAPGADPLVVAAELGLEFLDVTVIDGDKVGLFADPGTPVDPVEVDQNPGVHQWSTNYETTIVTGQTLIVGFYEGDWSRVTGGEIETAFEAYDLPSVHQIATGDGVTIAVLDTGADLTHPLLAPNVVTLPAHFGMSQKEGTPPGPAYGHGTAVAGAMIMIAPDVQVLPIRVLNEQGEGSIYQLYRGMLAAMEEGVDIINLSLSINVNDPIFQQYVGVARGAGITVLAAAGNAGHNHPAFPGIATSTLGVAALSDEDDVATFSGVGQNIQLASPGVTVVSAYPSDGYALLTGTSISTPIVSGCVALLRELAPASTSVVPLTSTATPVLVEGQTQAGLGAVDPLAALTQAP